MRQRVAQYAQLGWVVWAGGITGAPHCALPLRCTPAGPSPLHTLTSSRPVPARTVNTHADCARPQRGEDIKGNRISRPLNSRLPPAHLIHIKDAAVGLGQQPRLVGLRSARSVCSSAVWARAEAAQYEEECPWTPRWTHPCAQRAANLAGWPGPARRNGRLRGGRPAGAPLNRSVPQCSPPTQHTHPEQHPTTNCSHALPTHGPAPPLLRSLLPPRPPPHLDALPSHIPTHPSLPPTHPTHPYRHTHPPPTLTPSVSAFSIAHPPHPIA